MSNNWGLVPQGGDHAVNLLVQGREVLLGLGPVCVTTEKKEDFRQDAFCGHVFGVPVGPHWR